MEEWKKKLRFSSVSVICIMVVSICLIVALVMSSEKMSFSSSLLTMINKSTRVSGDDGAANLIHESETQSAAAPTKERGVLGGVVDIVQTAKPPAGVLGGDGGGTNKEVVSPSPPPLDIQDTEFMIQYGETMNTSAIANNTLSPLDESQVHPNTTAVIRRTTFSNLESLEGRMQQARAAIRDAKYGNEFPDPYYVPRGPMYWNAKSFHRSYMEMEKQFKVFVYEEGEHPIFHNGPCRSIYSMEGNFIYLMENTRFRTRDPNNAHLFFLPISVTSIVHFIFQKNINHHWRPMKNTVKDYVDLVAGRYSFWNRSLGADHFMLACHDWGPELSKSVPELYGNSIRALCNANTSEGFKPTKDVSIPEINLPKGTIDGLIGGPSPSKRSILVFFAGGLHGPIRPILFEHWENKNNDDDKDVQIHRYLPKGVSYLGMMKQSKFCICPSGYEVASPRMVEAIYSGCVPVLIKDHYVAPFSDVLNWKTFSVIIPVEDIPNLKKILSGISTRQYIRMQQRGKQIRRHFELNFPPKKYDVFHMILHSLWLRRLNVRVHGSEES